VVFFISCEDPQNDEPDDQIQNLSAQKEITLVQTQPATAYVKTGRRPGRPKKSEQIAKSNHKIN
jgi:hypothetical protein